jgi:hypothetical protein
MRTTLLALLLLLGLPAALCACGGVTVQQSQNPECDGIQQPRETRIDEPFDADADGFFDGNNPDCAATYAVLDCDDGDAEIFPGHAEVACNDLDDDCAPLSPDSVDADGDGVDSCDDCNDDDPDVTGPDEDSDGDGYGICAEDCDDEDPTVHPDAEELCDGLDGDCDGQVPADEEDDDGDGARICDGDCDDDDSARAPGLDEACDGVDNDCDELLPEDELDQDGDGVMPCAGDCNDLVYGGVPGSCDCPLGGDYPSCAAALADGHTEDGWFALLLPGDVATEVHLCVMAMAGGGWTMALSSSDDGVDTFTYASRTLLTTDPTPVGAACDPSVDYRGSAWHAAPMSDLLFVHRPSGVWARYDDVGDGSQTSSLFLHGEPFPACLSTGLTGFPMHSGSLTVDGDLCDTDLYFNPGDHEADELACSDPSGLLTQHAFGPAWNVGLSDGCPFDDPGSSGSIGPLKSNTGSTYEYDARGFGAALGLNTGQSGLGENRIEIYVR